jgi:E3 ubiquitin-protein ligase ATL4
MSSSSSSASLQPPPAGATGGSSPYSTSSSFLPSFMIIAALLAFVFLASVSIHLLLRFLSARSSSSSPPLSGHPRPRTYRDDAGSAAASVARRPAATAAPADAGKNEEEEDAGDEKQRLIDSLPLFTMASALAALPKSSPDCAVCLSPFTPDADLRLLPACRHAFHAACVDAWLRTTPSCPLCRAAVALPHPSLSGMLAAAQARARDRPGPGPGSSFLVEMGTVSNRGSPAAAGGGRDRNRNRNSRTYSLGSAFDYQIDEEVEAVVSRVARIAAARESSAVKEEKPSAEQGSAPAPAPAPSPSSQPPPPGETVAEAAGSSRGWLREYVDRLASSAYTLSERWSSRWSQGQSQQQRQEEPWLWDAEAAEMSAAPGSDDDEEETAFMAMYRWIAGV